MPKSLKKIMYIAQKPLEWIGSSVLLLGNLLKFLWMSLRVSWQTKRGKTRWVFLAIVLLTILLGLYNYPNYYNTAVDRINPKIANLANWQAPSYLAWLKNFSGLKLPKFIESDYRLGLDLVGGTQLLYDADTSKIPEKDRAAALEGVRDVIERRVNAFGVAEPVVQTDRSNEQWRVLVELAGIENVQDAINEIGETPLLEFKEQDPAGPSEPQLTNEQQAQLAIFNDAALSKAKDLIKQIKEGADFGDLAREFSDDPGSKEKGGELGFFTRGTLVEEFDRAIFDELEIGEVTEEPVKTQFGYHIIQKIEERVNGSGEVEVNSRHILLRTMKPSELIAPDPNAGWLNTELSGKHLDSAQVTFGGAGQQGAGNQPQVSLEFNSEGGELFKKITERNIGKPIAIFLDGQPISIPTVQQAITGGNAVITGQFTVDEAKLLAQRLNAGALPVPITLVSQQTVGATLGEIAIAQSLKATIVGFLMVIIFMILYYRLLGLISVFALIVYALVVLSVFKFWPVTLTLAGITGFILSIGMAVDANVLIFERLKEELKAERSLVSAVEIGFNRAWTSIRDSNASSLITCAILYWFGTSVIRGFALTLAIGIVLSMFSAIFVSRTFLRLVVMREKKRRLWWYCGKGVSEQVKESSL